MKKVGWWWWASMGGLVVVLILLFVSMGQYNSLKQELEDCEGENSGLSSQLTQSQSARASLQSDYDELSADYDSLSAERDAISEDLAAANQQIVALQTMPGPSYFSSVTELQAWLNANTISEEPWATTYWGWYAKGVRLQKAAADDGHVISVQYHYCEEQGIIEFIICIAVINDQIWAWDPETDILMQIHPSQIFPDYTPGLIY